MTNESNGPSDYEVCLWLWSLKYLQSCMTLTQLHFNKLSGSSLINLRSLFRQSSLHSTNKENEVKAATGYLVSLETPNWSIDEDLWCSPHWGTKRFYWSLFPAGSFWFNRGWTVSVAPCCGGIMGWRSICPNGARSGRPRPMTLAAPNIPLQLCVCVFVCEVISLLPFYNSAIRCAHIPQMCFPDMMKLAYLPLYTLLYCVLSPTVFQCYYQRHFFSWKAKVQPSSCSWNLLRLLCWTCLNSLRGSQKVMGFTFAVTAATVVSL